MTPREIEAWEVISAIDKQLMTVWPYKILCITGTMDNGIAYCKAQFGKEDFTWASRKFFFKNHDDAVLFKLTWQ